MEEPMDTETEIFGCATNSLERDWSPVSSDDFKANDNEKERPSAELTTHSLEPEMTHPPPGVTNFEVPDSLVNGPCQPDHQLQLPKDVDYTGKCSIPTADDIETDNSKDGDEDPNRIRCFANQDAKVTPSPVLQYVLDVDQPFDTVISCADGRIGAHRLVLAAASPFIGDMFCSHDHRLGEVAVLVLPDVKMSTMKVLLNFCYTGTMFFPKEDEAEVLDTMRCLLLAEFGKISLKEVTIKAPPPPPPAPANSSVDSGNQPVELEPTPSVSTSMEVAPGPSGSPTQSHLEDLLSSSSEEENDHDDSGSESDVFFPAREKRPEEEEQERLAFANNFLRNKKVTSSEQASINYLIAPKPPGCKTKKLLCYHCPGAFKSHETLTTHLDNNHGIFLQSENLTKSEFETLTKCNVCATNHGQIALANACISKRSRARCFICFEIVRHKEFEKHVQSHHVLEQRNGLYIVKCRWCEAGMMLQSPIDNKAMAGHCYSNHFGGKNGTIEFAKEDVKPFLDEIKAESSPAAKIDHVNGGNGIRLEAIPGNSTVTMNGSFHGTPKGSSGKVTTKAVPAVLAMLQKASQKRKLMQESPECGSDLQNDIPKHFENPTKRARLDENGKRLQVAKRTGKPVGRLVYIHKLKNGVPRLESERKPKGKAKSVLIDVENLPKIYVTLRYSKTFVSENMAQHNNINQQEYIFKIPNEFPESKSTLEPRTTYEIERFDSKRRHSDSRCSFPCY